jgi:three-Cys-motif partner protein
VPARDLHIKPFDEGTKTKLEIYRGYVRAWLQVFLHAEAFRGKPFQFFDFFSGPGQNSTGEPGSPLILLSELLAVRTEIEQHRHDIRIFFNDQDAGKIDNLQQLCSKKSLPWQPRFESLDFADAFKKVQKAIGLSPSLVFIDQSGVKQITHNVFNALTQAGTTDFLFFTASSAKWRFGELLAPEINLPEDLSYTDVHRVLADKYREWAPKGMFIGHFSIKKKSNIYGLIFGSRAWRGMQKFLEIAWKLDQACGEADYEMEADTLQAEMDFDEGKTRFKKRKKEKFQEMVSEQIQSGGLKTDKDVFLYCLTNGFLPRVAKDVYRRLHNERLIKNTRDDFPRSSDAAMKQPRQIRI